MASPLPKLQKYLALAIQHHQAGRLAQAEQLYQKIIARDPRHADALRLLGVVAHQSGRDELAAELLGRAIAVNRHIAEYHSDLGLALHALGSHDQAIAAFQTALRLKPELVEAHFNLANTLRDAGQNDNAIATYQIVLQLQPRHPEALNNLGNAYQGQQRFEQAIAAYRAALAINPNFADALANLGNALQALGRGKREYRIPHKRGDELDQSIAAYRAALARKPDDPQIYNNLGSALEAQDHFAEAIACYQTALRLKPRYAEALFNLGNVYQGVRQFEQAVAAYRAALDIQPDYPEALNNLANALKEQSRLEEAIAAYRAALALKPGFAEAHNNLGTALKDHGLIDEAIASYRAALLHKPDYAEALSNMGNAFKGQGLLDESIAAFRQAVALRPGMVELHNNLVYTLHFHPGYTPQTVAAELRDWSHRHAEPMARLIQPHENDRNPHRPLRIGWVSQDFRSHPIGRFLLPLFAAHDREDGLFFCYSDVPFPPRQADAVTARIREYADRWHNTQKLTHKELAALIRFDQVDILLDLTMHMQGSRLLTFAQKPAPVQMTYLAYPTSTGLVAMDYRLTDGALDPPDADTSVYIEKTLRLRSYWCYPAPEGAPAVTPLPARVTGGGHVTFACLNNFSKVSPQALRTWIDILLALPESRLLLHTLPGSHRDRLRATLAAAGIDPARCEFVGFLNFADYLALHHQIDIALDPFPYAGGTTSCDALYMGVPLVTWAGPTALSRGGVSLLTALGLPELIAATPESYVEIAVKLTQDLPRLEQLRATLRDRMAASPLMDAQGFARDFQKTLRTAWCLWAGRHVIS